MGKLMRPIGDLDLHLFGEGTHRRLWELLGPQPLQVATDGEVFGARFAVWAPDVASASIAGEWNGFVREPMAPVGVSGIWATVAPSARAGHRYAFDVDGSGGSVVRQVDPMARTIDHGADLRLGEPLSVVTPGDLHIWTDDDWMSDRSPRADDIRIGAGCVEVAPSAPIVMGPVGPARGLLPGLFAVPDRFGDPDALRRFVDSHHGEGAPVVIEWRLAVAPGGFEQLEHNEVRNQLMAAALYWLEEFHVDGLRVRTGSTGSDLGADPALASVVSNTVSVVSEEFPDVVVVVD